MKISFETFGVPRRQGEPPQLAMCGVFWVYSLGKFGLVQACSGLFGLSLLSHVESTLLTELA